MSFSESKFDSADPARFQTSFTPQFESDAPFVGSDADRAVDQALRNVVLPDGLLSRLGALVCKLSDDATDRMDYLGC